MKLYYKSGACGLSPNIILNELGLKPQLVAVDLTTKKTQDGKDFYAINSKGYIPALELDDGTMLTEGVAIALYLASLKPEAKLAEPAGTTAYWRLVEWMVYIATELHKGHGAIFGQSTPEGKEAPRNKLRLRLDWLETQLKGKQFAFGDRFTVVDAYLYNVLSWVPRVDLDLKSWPSVASYFEALGKRPSVLKAVADQAPVQAAA